MLILLLYYKFITLHLTGTLAPETPARLFPGRARV